MKKLLYMAMALMMSMASVTTFTACGDDDDDVESIVNNASGVNSTTDGNTITTTAVEKGVVAFTQVATFNDEGECTSFILKAEFADNVMADAAWNEYKDEYAGKASRNGKTITVDMTEEFAEGATKQNAQRRMEEFANDLLEGFDFDEE